jgi:hypothetical protein
MDFGRPEEQYDFPKDDATQRGETPESHKPRETKLPPVDPKRRAEVEAHVRQWMDEKGRTRQNGLWPYLLIRAMLGDHGVRPVPWPPTPFWESPDIFVVPGDVPSLAGQMPTLNPRAGVPHSVFVHVWNIGTLTSLGTKLSVFWANPTFSFDDPVHPPHPIGVTFVDLPDRLDAHCHKVVKIPQLWTPVEENDGHECLLARLHGFMDGAGPGFDARVNRHIGQLNVQLLPPQANLGKLLGQLSAALPNNAELHLIHGMGDVTNLLRVHQPALADRFVAPQEIPRQATRFGKDAAHLGAALTVGRSVRIVPPSAITQFGRGVISRETLVQPNVTAVRDDVLRPSDRRTPARLNVAEQLVLSLGVRDLNAGTLATTLGGDERTAHLLRFEARKDGVTIGGYTIIVTAGRI